MGDYAPAPTQPACTCRTHSRLPIVNSLALILLTAAVSINLYLQIAKPRTFNSGSVLVPLAEGQTRVFYEEEDGGEKAENEYDYDDGMNSEYEVIYQRIELEEEPIGNTEAPATLSATNPTETPQYRSTGSFWDE